MGEVLSVYTAVQDGPSWSWRPGHRHQSVLCSRTLRPVDMSDPVSALAARTVLLDSRDSVMLHALETVAAVAALWAASTEVVLVDLS